MPKAARKSSRFTLRFPSVWVVCFLLLGALGVVWGLATPMPSGGDEPAQAIKAAAVARGQLIGVQPKGFPRASAIVVVPRRVSALAAYAPCFYGDPRLPSHPCHVTDPGPGVGASSTYVAHYPPAYYAVVGLPTAISDGRSSIRLMRVVSALLGALFLSAALAAATVWSRNRWLVAGVAACITPVTMYLVSVVNPSGIEISTAIAAWTAGVIIVLERSPARGGAVVLFVASCLVMVFSRPLAILWVPVILVVLALLDPAGARSAFGDWRLRVGVLLVGAGTVGAAIFVLLEDSLAVEYFPLQPHTSTAWVVKRLLRHIPTWISEFVGQFGSPNFGGPAIAVGLWLTAASAILILGVRYANLPQRVYLSLYTVGSIAVFPFVATLTHVRTQGLGWQGRYNLPLAVGIPILAASLIGRRSRFPTFGRGALVAVWVVAQYISLYFVFARYRVGLGSVLHPFNSIPNPWNPPLGVAGTLVVGLALVLACGGWLWVCTAPSGEFAKGWRNLGERSKGAVASGV